MGTQLTTYYGNLENVNVPSANVPPIYLGLKHPVHFQSLVPTKDHVFTNLAPVAVGTIEIHDDDDEDTYSTNGEEKVESSKDNKQKKIAEAVDEKCPNCKKSFKLMLKHVTKHNICSKIITAEKVNEIRIAAEERRKAKGTEKVSRFRGVKRKIDPEAFKENERLA